MANKPSYEELEQRVKVLEKIILGTKQAEGISEEILERYPTLIHEMYNGFALHEIICDNSGTPCDYRFLEVNSSFEKMTQLKAEKIIGRTVLEVLPQIEKYWIETYGRVALTRESVHFENYSKELDRYYDVLAYSPKEGQFATVFTDITERKRAVNGLAKSEAKFRNLVESSPLGLHMYRLKSDGRLIFSGANPAADRILGINNDQFIGKTIEEAFPPLADTEIPSRYREAAVEGKMWETEQIDYSHGEIQGAYKVIAFQTNPHEMACMFEDITDRKLAEEALRESEEKYRLLTELLPLAIFELDNQGKITFANKAALKSTGFTQKDIDDGLNMLQVIAPQDHDRALRMSQQVMQGGSTNGSEYMTQRKDGSAYPSFIHTRPSRSKKPGLIGYIFDLTRLKEAEEALRESEEKLARSKKMESLGLLAGGVAHDLNNVLSGIVSYPELLLIGLPKDSKFRKHVETIQESGQRAAAIVQDLLTVARGVAITKEPLNLNNIVSDYLSSPEFIKLEQLNTTVTIKTNLDTDLLNISGSQVHIRKVVMNLVSNASEAIEGSGNITISTTNRYLDRSLRGYDDVNIGEYAVLSVSDDGQGISPVDLARLFEPFYSKKIMGRSGTGLGLAVVWNIVQDHKGYIDVITDKNGTTFELYLPITREEVLRKDLAIPIEDFKGDGETILVVDDVKSQRDISCNMLDTLGYNTKAVSSGEEAVEYLKEHSVDLILLDMIMDPGISGRETYKRIVDIHPKQKAIIISGFAETDDVKEAQKLGAGPYIKKPLTLQQLGMAVKEKLER